MSTGAPWRNDVRLRTDARSSGYSAMIWRTSRILSRWLKLPAVACEGSPAQSRLPQTVPGERATFDVVQADVHAGGAQAACAAAAADRGEDMLDAGNRPHLRLDGVDRFPPSTSMLTPSGVVDAGLELRFVDVGGDVVLLHEVVQRHVRPDHRDHDARAPASENASIAAGRTCSCPRSSGRSRGARRAGPRSAVAGVGPNAACGCTSSA